ncbi:hypothetical protein [Lentzea xinjiangensis]|uniref:hypothetical protein n=1 Tax=Lentzea xinjiangensis TaxID=402600 RepID=UPI001160A3BB|nr:hypothetical protein [Lentzea xinjiangensis]
MTFVLALFPLTNVQTFYFWDDSAAVFVPGWHHIGTELLAGRFPVLSPDMWPGGNIAAEAQLSLWNPIMLANYVVVALMPDLAVAATMVKLEFMVLMGTGRLFVVPRVRRTPGAVGGGRRAAAVRGLHAVLRRLRVGDQHDLLRLGSAFVVGRPQMRRQQADPGGAGVLRNHGDDLRQPVRRPGRRRGDRRLARRTGGAARLVVVPAAAAGRFGRRDDRRGRLHPARARR